MDHTDRLRRLAFNVDDLTEDENTDLGGWSSAVDPRTLALAQMAALVAVGGAEPSFGAQTDAAVSAGATPAEIVDVLVGIIPIIGLPRVVAAAPKIAIALGYEIEEAFSQEDSRRS